MGRKLSTSHGPARRAGRPACTHPVDGALPQLASGRLEGCRVMQAERLQTQVYLFEFIDSRWINYPLSLCSHSAWNTSASPEQPTQTQPAVRKAMTRVAITTIGRVVIDISSSLVTFVTSRHVTSRHVTSRHVVTSRHTDVTLRYTERAARKQTEKAACLRMQPAPSLSRSETNQAPAGAGSGSFCPDISGRHSHLSAGQGLCFCAIAWYRI